MSGRTFFGAAKPRSLEVKTVVNRLQHATVNRRGHLTIWDNEAVAKSGISDTEKYVALELTDEQLDVLNKATSEVAGRRR